MQVNLGEAKAKLLQLVRRAAKGEEIVIAKAGKPKVVLIPYRPMSEDMPETQLLAGTPAEMRVYLDAMRCLVSEFGEVDENRIKAGLKSSHLVAVGIKDGIVIGCGALKNLPRHRKTLATSHDFGGLSDYDGELGYLAVKKEFQGRGIASAITKKLLLAFAGPVYATAREDNESVRRLLSRFDFKTVGKTKPSRNRCHQIGLWVRATK